MSAATRYAYVNARLSLMGRRLWPQEQIEALVDRPIRRDLELFAGTEMEGVLGEEEVEPAVLEHAWLLALLSDFSVLLRGLTGRPRDLLVYWLRRFELGNLKAIIRGKMSGLGSVAIRQELVGLGAFATLKVEDLLATEDVAELLRRLEATPYSDIVRPARAVYEEHHDLFMVSATLDRRLFTGLANRARALEGEDRRFLDRLVGSIIDHTNLVWLLRYRLAYDLAPAQAYFLLVPGGYRVTTREWLQLAEMSRLSDILAGLPPALSVLLEGATTVSEIQRRLELETRRVAYALLWGTAFNLGRVLAYLVLREMEMHQVLAVLKGRRFGVDPGLIRFAADFAPLPQERVLSEASGV